MKTSAIASDRIPPRIQSPEIQSPEIQSPEIQSRGLRIIFILTLVAGAIIAVFPDVGFAQAALSKAQPQQSDTTATRQRRISGEDAEAVVIFKINSDGLPRASRRVFVRSTSLLVRAAVVEDKLLKRPEFNQLGFVITRELSEADVILELRHDLFTMYVFTVVDAKTELVLTSGKLSSLGGTVAGKVAKRFVKEMVRSPGP